jgi:hypothetical protein
MNADASLPLPMSHNARQPWNCVPVREVQARLSILLLARLSTVLLASSLLARVQSLPGTPRLPKIRRPHPHLRHARPIHHGGNHDALMVHPSVNPADLKMHV